MEFIWPPPDGFYGAKSSHWIIFSSFVPLLSGVLPVHVNLSEGVFLLRHSVHGCDGAGGEVTPDLSRRVSSSSSGGTQKTKSLFSDT